MSARMPKDALPSPHKLFVADLTKMLAARNWVPESNADLAAVNDLALFVYESSVYLQATVSTEALLDTLIAKTRPVTTAESSYSIDDQLVAELAARNWLAVTDADVAALSVLKKEIFETRIFVDPATSFELMLQTFIARNTLVQ